MSPIDETPLSETLRAQAGAMRGFNRFYTRRIGVLNERLLDSPFTLTQMRVLYEIGHAGEQTAQALRRELGLDAGYLSRILSGFEAQGLTERRPDPSDGRQALIRLTEAGRETLAPWEEASTREIAELIEPLGESGRRGLLGAMGRIEALLGAPLALTLRAHRPGDLTWIVSEQSKLYADEYGWNEEYEALAGEIAVGFLRDFDPERERCWIAELGGEPAGAVLLVKQSDETAKLRLLHVQRWARRRGVGRRLVGECVETARRLGYSELALWTQSALADAQRLYESVGFEMTGEEEHLSFGQNLIGRFWRLAL